MKILVFGAGGNIGSRIVGEAVRRGHDVTAAYRDADQAESLAATKITATVAEAADVLSAQRFDAVVSAVGAGVMSKSQPDFDVYLTAANSLVSAFGQSATTTSPASW